MNNNLEIVFYGNSTILEGPEWNPVRHCISCVSILDGCIYIIYEGTGRIDTICMNCQVGCALWIDSDHLVVASYNGIFKVNVDTGHKVFINKFFPGENIRYNDGIFDRNNRLLIGTTGYNRLAKGENVLYSYSDGKSRVLIEGTTISNGIAFSPQSDYMYFVDTPTCKIARYKYDLESGNALFDRYIIMIDEGMPDGICMDQDGYLWVAQWGGYRVSKWDAISGECVGSIKMPCLNVSSCCIGGTDMSWLYITTAKHDDNSKSEIMAGALFKCKI